MSNETEAKIWELMGRLGNCMLASHDEGMLRARPMHAIPDEAGGAIWFLTDKSSHKDEEVTADPRVCLAFADEGSNVYVSVSGQAEVSNDRARIHDLWSDAAQAFFPGGPDDSSVRLLKVVPSRAEYWDGPSSNVMVHFKMAAARMKGETPEMGENRKTSLG